MLKLFNLIYFSKEGPSIKMTDKSEWKLKPHKKLVGSALPSGLYFPEVVNAYEMTFKAVAFAPDDSALARIVRLTRVIVNDFSPDDRGGTFGKDKVKYPL